MIYKNDSVYPVIIPDLSEHFGSGLTKRELFSAMAMQGFNSNPDYSGNDMFEISRLSVKSANLLIEELNK
jgi:hypothetical protein